jgi:hypothetical protein
MSRWTIALLSLTIITFSFAASAADDGLPRNIELKPGAAPADEAEGQTGGGVSSGTTTRQIVTEGKNAPTADPSKDGVAPEIAPPASAPAAPAASPPPPGKAEGPPPPSPAPQAPQPPAEAAIPAPPPPPGLKPEEVVIAVQTELKRVGCDPGVIDGAWGGWSREALAAFGHFAKVDFGKLAPTPEILELIKGKAEMVCVEPAPPEHHGAPPEHNTGYGGGGYSGGGGYGGGGGY